MAKKKPPIDPLDGPKIALAGDVVSMDDALTVTRDARLYIDKGAIVAIRRSADPAPPGFETAPVVNTGGTLFPGLIELHNHLAYNALRLWQVPKKYSNRDQWAGIAEYRRLVSGPMTVVGKTPSLLPALIRYVEAKCLVGGVTTSQGIALFSNAGIRRFYRGIVRNVEETDEADLPEAETRIADVEAKDASKFLARLKRETCFLLHLSEGVDAKARAHFLALNIAPNEWAIGPAADRDSLRRAQARGFQDPGAARRLDGLVADEQSLALRRDGGCPGSTRSGCTGRARIGLVAVWQQESPG